jgi:DNA modification methylase
MIQIGNTAVHVGDCLESLRAMPERSVNCCVTSPPYRGLRDYGTARWDGGNADCDHLAGPLAPTKSTLQGYTGPTVKLAVGGMPYRNQCGKCGAVRIDNQLGLEPTPEAYVAKMVEVFREVRRVLRDDGTLWLNLGDSYATNTGGGGPSEKQTSNAGAWTTGRRSNVAGSLKPKDLVGIPWRVAFALQADGWYLRQDIIWAKPNPMPESVTDRCTKAHEYVFLMAKSERYFYDADAVKEAAETKPHSAGYVSGGEYAVGPMDRGGHSQREGDQSRVWAGDGKRNRRSVWQISTRPYKGAHFATFPPALIEPCIKAGCPVGGTVLDPFGGSGTTGRVATDLGRNAVLCELNPKYVDLIRERLTAPAKPVKKSRKKLVPV